MASLPPERRLRYRPRARMAGAYRHSAAPTAMPTTPPARSDPPATLVPYPQPPADGVVLQSGRFAYTSNAVPAIADAAPIVTAAIAALRVWRRRYPYPRCAAAFSVGVVRVDVVTKVPRHRSAESLAAEGTKRDSAEGDEKMSAGNASAGGACARNASPSHASPRSASGDNASARDASAVAPGSSANRVPANGVAARLSVSIQTVER